MTALYRYYKFSISEGNSASEIAVAEFQLYKSTTNISNNKTATANGYYSTYNPAKAVDNNASTLWHLNAAGPWWFQIDLGSPDYINTYKIQAGASPYAALAPKSWTLTGSRDGNVWYTIQSVSNETSWTSNQTRTYTPTSNTISGTTRDKDGNFASFTVRAHRRDTGELLATTTSNAGTGAYTLTFEYTGEVQVVMLDDAGGTTENDLIHRSTPI